MKHYILGDDHEPIKEPNIRKWSMWMVDNDRHLAESTIGPLRVSTVFLGLDHAYLGKGPPVLFETMVFGFEDGAKFQDRCVTWEQAHEMHVRACTVAENMVRKADRTLATFLASTTRNTID